MNKGTKTQMVEFINKRCRVNGKKIPKTRLNQLDKEALMEVINSQEAMAKAYQEFLKLDRMLVVEGCKNDYYPDAAKKLEHLTDAVVKNPSSFLALSEIQEFIMKLPYGSVSFDTLNRMVAKVGKCEPTVAFQLLEYIARQEEYKSKREKEEK